MEHQQKPPEDRREQVTVRLWKIAALMLFIANAPTSRSPLYGLIISLCVLAAVAIGTWIIWKSEYFQMKPEASTQQQLKDLEERLANLETINNFERRLAEESLRRHDASSVGKVLPDEQGETTSEVRRVAI